MDDTTIMGLKMLAIALVIAIGLALPAYLAVCGYRAFETRASSALAAVSLPPSERDPERVVVFHTFHGLLIWVTTTRHVVPVVGDGRLALEQLRRLQGFTTRWGALAYGCAVVPLLSLVNYLVARRRVLRLAARR